MRLTGITPLTPPTTRPASASTADQVAASSASRPTLGNESLGVSTILGRSEQTAPVDTDRVAEIRKAIQENRYPLVPAEIADALIAAKLFWTVAA